jgi:hypothetical protein
MHAIFTDAKMKMTLALLLAGLCAACSSVETLFPGTPSVRTQAGVEASHPSPETSADKIVALPLSAADLDCPIVEVEDGAATSRFGGDDNKAVRYQFDIANTARECQPQGSQFSLKVGISGRLLIGPAGSPGAYSTVMKVLVRRELDQKTAFEKSYKVEADTSGGVQAPFQVVTEPILLPFTRADLNDDYSVFVGFENGRNVALERPRRHGKPKHNDAH